MEGVGMTWLVLECGWTVECGWRVEVGARIELVEGLGTLDSSVGRYEPF